MKRTFIIAIGYVTLLAVLPGCFSGQCRTDADCDDGVWCNGQEYCGTGGIDIITYPACVSAYPLRCCPSGPSSCEAAASFDSICAELNVRLCDEAARRCNVGNECQRDADCSDGVFCNGRERCLEGVCFAPVNANDACCRAGCEESFVCEKVNVRLCDEISQTCGIGQECQIDADCDDGVIENGDEWCVAGLCFP